MEINTHNKKRIKVCLISSSGGHFSQVKQLLDLSKKYEVFLITEDNPTLNKKNKKNIYYLMQQDRKKASFFIKLLLNTWKSLLFYFKEKPKVVISTGAGATLPMLIISKVFGAKIIFIESFAKVSSPTITGKIVYKFCDRFYVQWPELINYYPKAIYRGKLY